MIIIDAFLRFSGVGLMIFMSVLALRDLRNSPSLLFLLLANISITSHFLGFTPDIFQQPHYLQMLFRFLDIFQLLFIWLFALSLFQKDFKLSFFHLAVGSLYSVPIFMERLVQFEFINSLPGWWAILVNGSNILLVVHMMAVTLKGRTDDLIEKRRKSRVYLVLMSAFSSVSAVVFGSILFSEYQATVDVLSIWPAIIWISYWLASVEKNKFTFDVNKTTAKTPLSSRDLDLHKKLKIEVIERKCFLENNLSIESLAKKLGVSAYRLRGFINKTLGHTNFSSYINAYRIDSIKKDFLNAENNHIPILTIAMNNGFNSLPPFNRAFKSVEGVTPSEFRQHLSKSP